jgi:subtilisin family serine protease
MAGDWRKRLSAQLDIIEETMVAQEGKDTFGFYSGGSSDNDGEREDFQYLFRRGRILVRDTDKDEVQQILGYGEVVEDEDTSDGVQTLEVPDVTQALGTLEEHEPRRTLATPEHIVYVTASPSCCPATEPEVVDTSEPVPTWDDSTLGEGARVSVVDTGWYQDAASDPVTGKWMSDVTGEDDYYPVPGQIPPYGGHGTFIAGVVRCMAPKAEVYVEGFLRRGGIVLERKMFKQVKDALEKKPDIISLSAGTPTRHNKRLLAIKRIREIGMWPDKTILVAAAGNDDTDRRFYPAAFKWAYSVGSIDPSGKKSDFSNYGDWVDAYALGRDLVNAFPDGTYTCHYPENGSAQRVFSNGLARWSGTSFATPMVAGIIAARMTRTGESSRQAADVLFGRAKDNRGTTGGLAVISPGPHNYM